MNAGCGRRRCSNWLDPGIDSFGPPHYTSLGWPVLLLTVLGMRSLTERLRDHAEETGRDETNGVQLRFVPLSLAAGLVMVTFALYLPARLGTLAVLASDINRPRHAVADAGLHDVIIFAEVPFAPACNSRPARHFFFWRPNNDPGLENDVLWANHLSVEQDKELMELFSDRTGYIMRYVEDCQIAIIRLEALEPGSVPDGHYP